MSRFFVWRKKADGSGWRARSFPWGKRFFQAKSAKRYAKSGRDRVSQKNPELAGRLTIRSRSDWGARKASGVSLSHWNQDTITIVHHTASAFTGRTLDEERNEMRTIQNFHMNQRGWNDIGYHYVIFPSGRVYEGRGRDVVGAHAPGYNTHAGICFAGNYQEQVPTPAALRSYDNLRNLLGLRGKEKAHGSVYSTACPGKNLKRALGL